MRMRTLPLVAQNLSTNSPTLTHFESWPDSQIPPTATA